MFLFGPLVLLIGLALGAYTAYDLARHWRSFWDDDIRPEDQARAARVAFLLIIPLGVLLHEFGHALAVWQLGGQVRQFNWSYLSGYVVPDRRFDPLGEWWVFFSGNLVSILLPILALGVLLLPVGRMPKYLAVTFARLEWYYSLIGYPLLSLGGAQGDWVAIYGIPPQPLKIVIGVVHVGLILLAVWLERRPAVRRWEALLSAEARTEVAAREAAIQQRPGDPQPVLALADFYARQGDLVLAQASVRQALALDPDRPQSLVAAGALAMETERYAQAADYYQQALTRLGGGPGAAVVAAWLGQAYQKLDRTDQAIAAYTQALDGGHATPDVFYGRARAYVRRRDLPAAREDFRRAAQLDPEGQIGRQAAKELSLL